MNRIVLLISVALFISSLSFAQKRYIFENRLVYTGRGYTNGLVKKGKYIIYWSYNHSAIAIETFDSEGAFSSLTIIDPNKNKIIALDEREKNGFSVPWNMYATNPDTNMTLDSTNLTGQAQKIGQWQSVEYKYNFPDGMTAVFWISNALFNSNILKQLQKTNFYFMRIPFGFNGVITKYQLFNKSGQEIANLTLKELSLTKYYVFDLSKYKISSPY